MSQLNVLVVDDDHSHREMLASVLELHGAKIQQAQSAEEALEIQQSQTFDLILLDLRMPGMGGMGFLRNRPKENRFPVVVLTAYAELELAVEAMKLGAIDFLRKPLDSKRLLEILDRVGEEKNKPSEAQSQSELSEAEAKDPQLAELPPIPENFVFKSPAMKQLLKELNAVAKSPLSVLLTGESGTGKEVLAQLLHNWSARSSEEHICVNVASLSGNLLESELFGHQKGSFTGAIQDHEGYFQKADKGTLFLDEIGEFSMELQPKLLRVLDSGCIQRVGDCKEQQVDVRVISATHRDLEALIESGHFRLDLYYRLAAYVVYVPPLRERPEDIEALAEVFLQQMPQRKSLTAAALEELQNYSWPGNVRELKNSLQRASILSSGDWILPEHLRRREQTASVKKQETQVPQQSGAQQLADIEKTAILTALDRNDGNRSKAAKELGISRRKLQYRLKDYGLQ